ncbi:MAG TPA: hypothetical protein VN980_15535 [Alphaproteobacteria bacterium]|nr:hypothetical protein [Alphaproteobacteria bacterium]
MSGYILIAGAIFAAALAAFAWLALAHRMTRPPAEGTAASLHDAEEGAAKAAAAP